MASRPLRRLTTRAALSLLVATAACSDGTRDEIFDPVGTTLADSVRALPRIGWFAPFTRHSPIRSELVRLGEALAFDPILSGPRNISCMTCHHPSLATADGRSVSVGQGATGLGLNRLPSGQARLTARNSPALFNLDGAPKLFHDG